MPSRIIMTANDATYSSLNRLLSFIKQLLNQFAIFRTRQQHTVTKPQEICTKKEHISKANLLCTKTPYRTQK